MLGKDERVPVASLEQSVQVIYQTLLDVAAHRRLYVRLTIE